MPLGRPCLDDDEDNEDDEDEHDNDVMMMKMMMMMTVSLNTFILYSGGKHFLERSFQKLVERVRSY